MATATPTATLQAVASAADEALLLDLLNTTPVVDDEAVDELAGFDAGKRWLAAHDQPASADEWRSVVEARDALQSVVRGQQPVSALAPYVAGVGYRADVADEGVVWRLDAPKGRTTAARVVLAWDVLRVSSPGRLRPCANAECQRFLIDHSKPNTARWCSMALCGNRMKARRHYQRSRDGLA